jgi:acyl dehydratase
MPIDPVAAGAATLPEMQESWDADDVILYHLGIGAGSEKPTDLGELAYTYERYLQVLPSFGVVPVFDVLAGINGFAGVDIDYSLVLHGEQDLELHRAVPPVGDVVSSARIAGVYDKTKAALIVIEVESHDGAGPLFTNRFGVFARGEGGFDGESSAPPPGNEPPDRAPDAVVSTLTTPRQALLYRLSGDKNPLHADPEFAAIAGFDTPILHGLCTYGIACKAVVDGMLGGEVARVARYRVRFTGVVYPGETIVTSMWRETDRVIMAAATEERGDPVLSNAAIWLREA